MLRLAALLALWLAAWAAVGQDSGIPVITDSEVYNSEDADGLVTVLVPKTAVAGVQLQPGPPPVAQAEECAAACRQRPGGECVWFTFCGIQVSPLSSLCIFKIHCSRLPPAAATPPPTAARLCALCCSIAVGGMLGSCPARHCQTLLPPPLPAGRLLRWVLTAFCLSRVPPAGRHLLGAADSGGPRAGRERRVR